jgi:hypothetical protein
MLGPHIPAERRMVLSQIIEKMASVWKEKKSNKGAIIQRWRILRLSEKLKMLGNQNLAYMYLCKIFDKRRNAFYKIRETGSVRNEQKTMQLTLQGATKSTKEFDEMKAKLAAAEAEVKRLAAENAELMRSAKMPGSPAKPTAELLSLRKEVEELRTKLGAFEAENAKLKADNAELLKKINTPASPARSTQKIVETNVETTKLIADKAELQKVIAQRDALQNYIDQIGSKFAAGEKLIDELRTKITSLEKDVLRLNQEKADLMRKTPVASPAQTPKNDRELIDLRSKILSYEKELQHLRELNQELTDQLANAGATEIEMVQPQKIKEKNSVVTRTITKIVQAPAEKIPIEHFGQVLTDLKKARYIANIFNHLQVRQNQKALYQILKAGIRSKRSYNEASLRMMGRLLQVLHAKYADVGGARKAFLRWWVVTHSTFQRDCITKVALNARITHQNALWRFRKLVRKNVKVQLPEAVRKTRYTSGLYLLDALVRADHVMKLIESFNAIRPAINGRRNKLLVKILAQKASDEEKSKLNSLHQIVNKHRRSKELIERLIDRFTQKAYEGLHHLIDNGKTVGKNNRDEKIRKMIDRLVRNANSKEANALDNLKRWNERNKAKSRVNKLLTERMIDRLVNGQINQLSDALNRLRDHRTQTILKEIQTHTTVEITKVIRQKKNSDHMSTLKDASRSKLSDALNRLRRHNADALAKQKDKNSKMRKLIEQLSRAGKGKEREALNELERLMNEGVRREITDNARKNINEATRDNRLRNLMNRIRNGYRGKLGQAFDILRTVNTIIERENTVTINNERVKTKLKNRGLNGLNDIAKNLQNKLLKQTIDRLREHNNTAKQNEIEKLRNKKNIMRALNRAGAGKLGDALNKLRNNNANETNAKTINDLKERIVTEKVKNGLAKLLDKLKKGQVGKTRDALKGLRERNNEMKSIENMEIIKDRHNKKLKNKTLINLINAQTAKEIQALTKLKDNQKKIQFEESEKNFEKTLKEAKERDRKKHLLTKLINSTTTKKGSSLRKLIDNALGQKFEEQAELQKQKLEKEKRDHLLKSILNKILQKRTDAFNKLVDNANIGAIEPAVMKKNRLVQDLINKQKTIQENTLRKLIQNSRNQEFKDLNNRDKKNKLLKKLLSAYENKNKDAINKLSGNSKSIKNIENETSMKFKYFMDRLSDLGQLKTKNDKVTCYNKMIAYAGQQKNKDVLKRKLINALIKGTDSKTKNAMYNLRQNNLLSWGEQRFNETLADIKLDKELNTKKKMLKKLFKAYGIKSSSALKQLGYNNDAIKGKEEEGKKLLDKLMFKSKNNTNNQLVDSYRRMKEYAKKNKEYERKFKNILTNILTQMNGNNKLSLVDAMNKLGKNKQEKSQQIANQMNKTKQLFNKIVNATNSKNKDALNKLLTNNMTENFADKIKKKGLKSTGIISKTETGLKNKLADAFNRLRVNALEQQKKKIIDETKLNKLINRLTDASEKKIEDAIKELGEHKNKLRDQERKLNDARAKLVNKLRDNIKNKIGNAADTLFNHGKTTNPAIDEKAEAIKKLAGKLKNSNRMKTVEVFKNLQTNKTEEAKRQEDRRRMIEILTIRINEAYEQKREEGVRAMRDKTIKEREEQKQKDLLKKKLIEKLIRGFDNKINDAVTRAAGNSRIIREKQIIEKLRKANLINKIGRGQTTKLSEAFEKLRNNNRLAEENERRKKRTTKSLISRLVNSSQDKNKQAFDKLVNNLRSGMDKAMREKMLKTNMINKLIKNLTNKQSESLDNLRDNLRRGGYEAARKRAAIKRLINSLNNGSVQKVQDAQDRLLKNKILTDTSERRQKILRNNAVRLFTEKIRDRIRNETRSSMTKMITHTLNTRVRIEKISKTVTIIKKAEQTKTLRTIYNMEINSLKEEIKNAERRLKLNHVIQRMYRHMIKDGYQRLLKNAFLKQKVASIFNKAEKLNNRRMMKSSLEVLKDLIRKSAQRGAKIFDFLSAFIRTRQLQAFSEFKVRYEIGKREKLNKGLMNLAAFYKKAVTTRNIESYTIIKKQFYVDNPWFRKTIALWTIHTASCTQIAFWKIKLLKDIGMANVPPQTAIKLRQFAEMFEKKKSRVLQATFTRLDVTRHGGSDSMNVSFLQSNTPHNVVRKSTISSNANMTSPSSKPTQTPKQQFGFK